MQRFVLALALLLPALALADNHAQDHGSMAEQMQQLMNMMNMMKGWGAQQPDPTPEPTGPTPVPWNEEDYQAYLKWCADNKMKWDMLNKTSEVVEDYREKQAAVDAARKEAEAEAEREERASAWMIKWKHWQNQLTASASFDVLQGELEEMKDGYYQQVALSFVQMCSCNDYAEEINLIFSHKGLLRTYYDINVFTIEDVEDIMTTNAAPAKPDFEDPKAFAAAINGQSAENQVTWYFSGLKRKMCDAARDWLEEVRVMERERGFLGKLADQ